MADEKATTEIQEHVMRIASPMLEKMYARGEISLTDEELAQLDGRPMVTMSSDFESRMPKKEPLGPLEWIEPLEAVDWLAPRIGGEAQAKSAILGRLIDGRIHCTCTWTCEQPDVGPLPQLRPRQVTNPSKPSEAFYVSEINAPSSVTLLGGAMWDRGEHWDEDQKRFKWAEGLFVSSFDNDVVIMSNFEDSVSRKEFLAGRIVAYGVRFNRGQVEAIVTTNSENSDRAHTSGMDINSRSQVEPSPAGRKMGNDWFYWIAEVVWHLHECGFDSSVTRTEFFKIINHKLLKQTLPAPNEDKVKKAISAIYRRFEQEESKGKA